MVIILVKCKYRKNFLKGKSFGGLREEWEIKDFKDLYAL
jgi:hypothetical protein